MYERKVVSILQTRLSESRRFIQVIIGPRQIGKTTAVHQFLKIWPHNAHYASADLPAPPQGEWIPQQWQQARMLARPEAPFLLIFDEIQKVADWSSYVKACWDEDCLNQRDIRVILLGSSSLLMQKGLTESLAGRFEQIFMGHWSYIECQEAFGWDIDTYFYFGGYPGAASLIDDENRFTQYVRDSLIETALSKDVFLMHRIEKPALLRQLFYMAVEYAGQIVSYQKFLGQLQDAGNTTTLAHYQRLLESAFLLYGLSKWHRSPMRKRASSPKWIILNNAILTSATGDNFAVWRNDPRRWGRLVENAIEGHLINSTHGANLDVFYWRDHHHEVDFVLRQSNRLLGIEVKRGATQRKYAGLQAFKRQFPEAKTVVVGADGIPLDTFLQSDIPAWFDRLFS